MIGHGQIPAPDPMVPCCIAAAQSAGEDCTCWRPILAQQDPEVAVVVQAPLQEGPACARRTACQDCAYRAGSPERRELDGAVPDYGRAEQFYCHDGMPFVAGWQHPSGAVRKAFGDDGVVDYHPATRSGRAWRTDGRPAVLCAGWAAVNAVPRADPQVDS